MFKSILKFNTDSLVAKPKLVVKDLGLASVLQSEKIVKFNHAHSPRGSREGGRFTSTFEPMLNDRGAPIKDKNGKYTPIKGKDGKPILKPPGGVVLSESHDSAHTNSVRNGLTGSKRTPEYTEAMGKRINEVQSLSESKNMSYVQQLGRQVQQSNLRNVNGRLAFVYATLSEQQTHRDPKLQLSTTKCPSESEMMACMIGQETHQSVKHFESNTAKGTVDVSGKQPNKHVFAEFKGSEFKDEDALKSALKEHFKGSTISVNPTIGKNANGNWGVHFDLPNIRKDGGSTPTGTRAAMAKVAAFTQSHAQISHSKHWNGETKVITPKQQRSRINQFVKEHPNHPLSLNHVANMKMDAMLASQNTTATKTKPKPLRQTN